jgi:hypothetical protein
VEVGRIPDPFARALTAVRGEQVAGLTRAWLDSLPVEEPARWAADENTTLEQDLVGLRDEASRALALGGALWLRIEL